jgi:hypothetical protein
MIQIHSASQFERAAERARREKQFVQLAGFRQFKVTNREKGTQYEVFFSRLNGKFFGTCTCAAGTPMREYQVPLVCKHLFAAYFVLRAIAGKVQPPPLDLRVVNAYGPQTELEGVTVCWSCVQMLEASRVTVLEGEGFAETFCEVCRAGKN